MNCVVIFDDVKLKKNRFPWINLEKGLFRLMRAGFPGSLRPPVGKGNSNSHGARPVHLIITMIKWFRTSRLSMLSLMRAGFPDSLRPPVDEIWEQLLYRNVQRFRAGLVFKARGLNRPFSRSFSPASERRGNNLEVLKPDARGFPRQPSTTCSEAGSYLRLIYSCITQLKAQWPSRTCNESKEEEEEATPPLGCGVQCWVLSVECWVLSVECLVLSVECSVLSV